MYPWSGPVEQHHTSVKCKITCVRTFLGGLRCLCLSGLSLSNLEATFICSEETAQGNEIRGEESGDDWKGATNPRIG